MTGKYYIERVIPDTDGLPLDEAIIACGDSKKELQIICDVLTREYGDRSYEIYTEEDFRRRFMDEIS